MINKLSFITKDVLKSAVKRQKNRWIAPLITFPGDHHAYGFTQKEQYDAYLTLLTNGNDNEWDKIANSSLNKFTSLQPSQPFSPPKHQLKVLRGIQVPQDEKDEINSIKFLREIRWNVEKSICHITKIDYRDISDKCGKDSEYVSRAISHVSSALIPNCLCIVHNKYNDDILKDKIREQLELLELGSTVEEASDKGIIVNVYIYNQPD